MPVAKQDHACATCTKRYEVPASELGGGMVQIPGRLECRALPPVQDVARHAVFPTVAPDHFCHVYFEVDAAAVKARREAAAATAELDAKVEATRAAAAAEAEARAAAAQPELALEPPAADQPAPRARRARAKAAK